MRTSSLPVGGTHVLARTRADPRIHSCTHHHAVGPSARRTRASASGPVTPHAGECLACRRECGAYVWTGAGPGERLVVEPAALPS